MDAGPGPPCTFSTEAWNQGCQVNLPRAWETSSRTSWSLTYFIVVDISIAGVKMLHLAVAAALISAAYAQNSTLPTVDLGYEIYRASSFNVCLL
jgi:hypothetical protein